MKDLANLYYFEKLLEDVNNDLVRQAQAKGNCNRCSLFSDTRAAY